MKDNEPFKLDVVSVRLVRDAPVYSDKKIECPQDAIAVIGDILCEMDREVICILNMKRDGTPINCSFASVGAVEAAIANPRDLLKCAILSNATGMIMIHNHPSGSLEPSQADCRVTDNMLQLTKLLNIEFQDHIIVGGDNREYFSFREKDKLEMRPLQLANDYDELDFGKNRRKVYKKSR